MGARSVLLVFGFTDRFDKTPLPESIPPQAGLFFFLWYHFCRKKHHFSVVLHTEQTETVTQWEQGLKTAWQRIAPQG